MRVVPALLLSITALIFFTLQGKAAELLPASIRLDRTKTSSPIAGLVCATPSSAGAGTEGQISTTFPASFSISSTASNWTTDTSGLPAGSTAWPGIGAQALTVSGKTVSFASADLTGTSRYCFYFSSSSSTTGTTTGNLTGTIATKTSGGSQIDAKGYGLTISTNDQVTLTATVPANATDFEAELAKIDPVGSTFSQDAVITYELTYGSSLAYNSTITLQAEWDLGTVAGSGFPSVETLEYVIGSASDGYNNTPPIIDTVNRTISWTITPFPGDTHDQTVTFQLRTTDSYTGGGIVSFPVSGRVIGPGTQTPDSTVTLQYQYIDTSPTATPGPTNSPTPGSAASPTPTHAIQPLQFTSIQMHEIATTSAVVAVQTTKPAALTLSYGAQPDELTDSITSANLSSSENIPIPGLQLNTTYYFRVTARSGSETTSSDIYTFKTPSTTERIDFDPDSLIVTANEIIVFNNNFKSGSLTENFFTIPKGKNFTFQLSQIGSERAESIQAFFQPSQVLGVQSGKTPISPSANAVTLVEIRPGVFLAQVTTPSSPGVYSLFLRSRGNNGSITNKEIARVRALNPLQVVDEESSQPVEGARLRLFIYNQTTRLFQEVSTFFKLEGYPLVTGPDGLADVVLPPGKYRVEVKTLNYQPAKLEFTIGPNKGEEYPHIRLKKSGFSVVNSVSYLGDSFSTVTSSVDALITTLFSSRRFYELVNILSILILIALTIISLMRHIGLPVGYVPLLLQHIGIKLFRRKKGDHIVSGEIIDAHLGNALAGVHVFILDGITHSPLSHTITNRSGLFTFPNLPSLPLLVRFEKQGYISSSHVAIPSDNATSRFALAEDTLPSEAAAIFRHVLSTGIGRFLEVLLLGSILVEVVFGYAFGWAEALPFLLVSLANLLYYLYYRRVSNSS